MPTNRKHPWANAPIHFFPTFAFVNRQRRRPSSFSLKLIARIVRYALIAGSLVYLVYAIRQVNFSSWSANTLLSHRSLIFLAISMLLVFVNYGIESRKWMVLLASSYPIQFRRSFRSVLAGTSATTFLPARSGEYLGRMLFLPDRLKLPSVAAGIIGGLGQLGTTLIVGLTAWNLLAYHPSVPFNAWFGTTSLFVVIVCGMVFILLFPIVSKTKALARWSWLEIASTYSSPLLSRVLLLSLLRYAVFTAQFTLLITGFLDVPVSFQLVVQLATIFFLQTIIPVPATMDLGIRMYAASFFFHSSELIVPVTVLWLINVILPATMGTIILALKKPQA